MSEEHIVWLIEWEDSFSEGSWVSKSRVEQFDQFRCFTVGIIIRETKKTIVLASTWEVGHSSYCSVVAIPRRAILRRIEVLRKPEEWWTQQERGRKKARRET